MKTQTTSKASGNGRKDGDQAANGSLATRKGLSPAHLIAIDCLLAGETDREAGEAATKSRETVSGWKNHNVEFQAEFNRRLKELQESSRLRLQALQSKALVNIDKAIEQGDVRVSWNLLKATGALKPLLPGSEDPHQLAMRARGEKILDLLEENSRVRQLAGLALLDKCPKIAGLDHTEFIENIMAEHNRRKDAEEDPDKDPESSQ